MTENASELPSNIMFMLPGVLSKNIFIFNEMIKINMNNVFIYMYFYIINLLEQFTKQLYTFHFVCYCRLPCNHCSKWTWVWMVIIGCVLCTARNLVYYRWIFLKSFFSQWPCHFKNIFLILLSFRHIPLFLVSSKMILWVLVFQLAIIHYIDANLDI